MKKMYASLVGPLDRLYYPLPFDDELTNSVALNSSGLAHLWCSIYRDYEALESIKEYGGIMLSDDYAMCLDYDSNLVYQIGEQEPDATREER